MPQLEGKVAIVTGAGRGIGRGVSLALAKAGAHVVVASRTSSTVDAVVDEIARAGGRAIGVTVDVAVRSQVNEMVDRAVDVFGQLDVLVNNAQSWGIPGGTDHSPPFTRLEDFTDEEWDFTFQSGLKGTLYGCQAAFPHLKETQGSIVNFGSGMGQYGQKGVAAYNACKEAIRALTRTAAREWGKYGITVNCINPAAQTESLRAHATASPKDAQAALKQTPLRRYGDPEQEIGGTVVFLASNASAYITGMTIMVDGGMLMQV